MKLYHFPISPNSRRVVAVIHHLGLECELIALDLSKGEHLTPEFINLNPNHMIPTLVDGDTVIWESNAIMQYLCAKVGDDSLWPKDPKKQAEVTRWQFWQAAHFGSACSVFIYEHLVKKFLNIGDPNPAEIAKGEERFHRFAKVLNEHLVGREWLEGNHVTLADYSVGSYLDLAEMAQFPMHGYDEMKRWYKNIEQLPAWQSSMPSKIG